MKRKSWARKPKKAERPLLTISEKLRVAAEELLEAKKNLRHYYFFGGEAPSIQIGFVESEGRKQAIQVLPKIEADAPVWLENVISDHLTSIRVTWHKIVAPPWRFTGEEIQDAKALLIKVAQKQGAVSAFLHKGLCREFRNENMNWETLTPNPTTPPKNERDVQYLSKVRERMMADPKTFPGFHPLVLLLNQNISSTCLSLPQDAIADIRLRPGTKRLLAEHPKKPLELARLNRLLLEDAFDLELAKLGETGVPSSGDGIQHAPCKPAFLNQDLLKFDEAADKLDVDMVSFLSALKDQEAKLSTTEIVQRLQLLREQGRKLNELATTLRTPPSVLSDRIIKVLKRRTKPRFLFRPSVFRVDEDNPLLLHDVPPNVFLDGPIPDFCDTLVAVESGIPELPVPPDAFRTIQRWRDFFCNCYPSQYDLCPRSDEELPFPEPVDADMKKYVLRCVYSLRKFVDLACFESATPGGEITAKPVADKTPAPGFGPPLADKKLSVAPEPELPQDKEEPVKDPQTSTVRIARPASLKALVKGAHPPDEIDVFVKDDTESPEKKCKCRRNKGSARQALLVLFAILGETGVGKVDKDEFLSLSFDPSSAKKTASDPVGHFNHRLGAKGDLRRETGICVKITNRSEEKKPIVTGPKFQPEVSQNDVRKHLMAHLWK